MAAIEGVVHSPVLLKPDAARTVVRPFDPGEPSAFGDPSATRVVRIARRVLGMDADALKAELKGMADSLDDRHRDVEGLLRRRFDDLKEPLGDIGAVSPEEALLIGAYFSEEFSFESAALFNPSVVAHPDQAGVPEGATRLVISLRGIGEGHVSSLTFRTGVWLADGTVEVDPVSPKAVGPRLVRSQDPDGDLIVHLSYEDAQEISETVVFPFMPSQGRGVEDVRLVEFTEDDGTVDYRGTYTAFNGSDVRQGLLRTGDFRTFEMRGVKGPLYDGKGLALFPRKVGDRYLALSRQDNESVWLATAGDLQTWDGGAKLISPRYPWEFIQMGNCGSPMEIAEGWLVLTHGVGAVRNYCVGACLLNKDDPSKVLARTPLPVLEPEQGMRDGYVPNVVYSCGGKVRGRTLLLPYGVADNFTSFATVPIDALLAAMA